MGSVVRLRSTCAPRAAFQEAPGQQNLQHAGLEFSLLHPQRVGSAPCARYDRALVEKRFFWMFLPTGFQRSCIALATTVALAGCASLPNRTPPLVNYQPEAFNASAYTRHYMAHAPRTCEASRRALLSQGYVVNSASTDQVTARKYFQPFPDHHVQLEFRVVCATDGDGSGGSTVFVNGLKDQYLVRKAKESASVGVGGIGSLSLPLEGNLDSMVKVSSETVTSPELYERFFELIGEHLARAGDADGGTSAAASAAAQAKAPPPAPAPQAPTVLILQSATAAPLGASVVWPVAAVEPAGPSGTAAPVAPVPGAATAVPAPSATAVVPRAPVPVSAASAALGS